MKKGAVITQPHKVPAGLTLVEIMIVVAIIGILAAIAIPSLVRMRLNANEATIKEDLRGFSSARNGKRLHRGDAV